jgi:hypothetical protein
MKIKVQRTCRKTQILDKFSTGALHFDNTPRGDHRRML